MKIRACCRFLALLFFTVFAVGLRAFAGNYAEEDKEALRKFLLQPSAFAGVSNFDLYFKASLNDTSSKIYVDTSRWEIDENWVTKISGVTWTVKSPKKMKSIMWNSFSYLYSYNYGGFLDLEGCDSLVSIDCSHNYFTRINLSGLHNLTSLSCYDNRITSLDLNENKKLTEVTCYSNSLSSLKVDSCLLLNTLRCFGNSLTALNLQGNPELRYLDCEINKLTFLDLNNNKKLTSVDCSSNQISTLNIDSLSLLTSLDCASNPLPNYTFENFPNLTYLNCYNIGIDTLIITHKELLQSLYCSSNPFRALNVDSFPNLATLYCDNSGLTELKTDCNYKLSTLNCGGNQITNLDLSKNKEIRYLNCSSNLLTEVNTDSLPVLIEFHCYRNQITQLNTDNNVKLCTLYCYNNPLIGINIDKNVELTRLDCSRTGISSLDLTKINKLDWLCCAYNPLGSLNVENQLSLTYLNCDSTGLTALNVSQNTYLKELYCSVNRLTVLDLIRNRNLTDLGCANNLLTTLNVGNSTSLTYLSCENNHISALDLSRHNSLNAVFCNDNQLSKLDLRSSGDLAYLNCANNQISVLKTSSSLFYTIKIDNNRLVFSSMPNPQTYSYYATKSIFPQSDTVVAKYNYDILDFRKEYLFKNNNGDTFYTRFNWFYLNGNVETPVLPGHVLHIGDGKFLIDTFFIGKTLRSKMSNAAFGSGIITWDLNITNSKYHPKDKEALRKFLRQTSNNETKLNLNQFGTSAALDTLYWYGTDAWVEALSGIQWDNQDSLKRILTLNWQNKNLKGTFDFEGCDSIYDINVSNNFISNIYTYQNKLLKKLNFKSNDVSYIYIGNNPALSYLDCSNNNLYSLTLRYNDSLETVYCSHNYISELDIKDSFEIRNFKCDFNKFRFSTLQYIKHKPLLPSDIFIYSPQDTSYYWSNYDIIVLKKEYLIQDVPTVFHWVDSRNRLVDSLIHDNGDSTFRVSKKLSGETIYCRMTNPLFPDLTLISRIVIYEIAVVTGEPVDSTDVCETKSFTLSVQAKYAQSYQWYRNGTQLYGATASSYTINYASVWDSGQYVCVVTSYYGSDTSKPGRIFMHTNPIILKDVQDITRKKDSLIRFEISTDNTWTFQWQFQGRNIVDAQDSFYIIPSLQDENTGYYKCILTNEWCSIDSRAASLIMYKYTQIIVSELEVDGKDIRTIIKLDTFTYNPRVDTFHIHAACGQEYVNIGISNISYASTQINAPSGDGTFANGRSTISGTFSLAKCGRNNFEIVLSAQSGTLRKRYIIVVHKPIKDNIFFPWDNVPVVNCNVETNGGYDFAQFQWYKDGKIIKDATHAYVHNPEKGSYTCMMHTKTRDDIYTCPLIVNKKTAAAIKVFPNPVVKGQALTVVRPEQNVQEIKLQSLSGKTLWKQQLSNTSEAIHINEHPGVYLIEISRVGQAPSFVKILVLDK